MLSSKNGKNNHRKTKNLLLESLSDQNVSLSHVHLGEVFRGLTKITTEVKRDSLISCLDSDRISNCGPLEQWRPESSKHCFPVSNPDTTSMLISLGQFIPALPISTLILCREKMTEIAVQNVPDALVYDE